MNFSLSSIWLHSFQGTFALLAKGPLCNPCLQITHLSGRAGLHRVSCENRLKRRDTDCRRRLHEPCQHAWIDDVDRLASRKSDDLVENVDELRLVFLPGHISDVRRRDDLFEPQQREIRVAHRLVLEHVNRGIAGPARAERGHERAGFDQRRAAGIDQHGLRSHARQILGFDDVARRRH